MTPKPGQLQGLKVFVECSLFVKSCLKVGLFTVGAKEQRLGLHHIRVVDAVQDLDLHR